MTPFQGDMCHFQNMQGRDPRIMRMKDRNVLKFICRANLAALWLREPSTVEGNFAQVRKMELAGGIMGFDLIGLPMGPFPLEDSFGMKVVCTMLRRSLDNPGKWEKYIQFKTARKDPSAYSNMFHASCQVGQLFMMVYETSKTYHTHRPTYGYWFERFILGCHKRMGDMVVSDCALSIRIFKKLLADLKKEWEEMTIHPITILINPTTKRLPEQQCFVRWTPA
jgi:hypothetical protein